MKKTEFFLIYFLFASILVFSQDSDKANMPSNAPNYFIGIDTGTSNNFTKIRETLERTNGIIVRSYCNQNNIIKLSFDQNVFQELTSIFDLIESQFEQALCYNKKHYTDESYNKMCNEELVKRNMGGTE